MDRRNFLLNGAAFLGAARFSGLDSIVGSAAAEEVSATVDSSIRYSWVVGEKQLAEMVTHMLGLDPTKVSDYFNKDAITPGKMGLNADGTPKERSLHALWPGDQVVFMLGSVPNDKRGSVEGLLEGYDANHGEGNDGTFAVPGDAYNAAVKEMTHGHLNGAALQKGYRILTLRLIEKITSGDEEATTYDGTVRRFVEGGTPEHDDVGHPKGRIYQAVRQEDVKRALNELEGKLVFGLGKLFDTNPELGREFANYLRTAKVGLQDPADEHFAIGPEGNLHRLVDKKTWSYKPALPAVGTRAGEVVARVLDTILKTGYETPQARVSSVVGGVLYK